MHAVGDWRQYGNRGCTVIPRGGRKPIFTMVQFWSVTKPIEMHSRFSQTIILMCLADQTSIVSISGQDMVADWFPAIVSSFLLCAWYEFVCRLVNIGFVILCNDAVMQINEMEFVLSETCKAATLSNYWLPHSYEGSCS